MDRRTTFLLIAVLVAACTPPGAAPAPGKGKRPPVPIALASGVPKPGGLASAPPVGPGGGLISDHGTGLIANNGGSLTGKVKAPAGLISNNGGAVVSNGGGGLVSNNGGGLVSNNGGGMVAGGVGMYRLRAVEQLAVAGARVELLDAAGNRARDRAGAEVPPATTDAQGAYAFTADLPTRNLVVRVVLPGRAGELRAIAPPDAAARRATDVDLVSTLAAGYILDKFVKGATDAQATLDKLPAAVEAETRRATAAALEKGAAPKDLAPATVVAAVDALRKADGALDAQLERVRALLVAAGLSDLGAGRPATEVALSAIEHVAATKDGRIFLATGQDKRIWTIDDQGRLQVAVGRSPGGADAVIDGKPGAEASIDRPIGMAADGDGLLILEPRRLSRLGPDRVLRTLATGLTRAKAVVPRPDGRPLVLTVPAYKAVKGTDGKTTQVEAAPAAALRVAPGGAAPEQAHAFPEAEGRRIAAATRIVAGPGGAAWIGLPGVPKGDPARVIAYDAATFAPAEIARRDAATVQLAFDDQGRIFKRAAGQKVLAATTGGGGFAPGEAGGRDFPALAQAPDGSWIFAHVAKAFRTTAAEPALVAGLAVPPREGRADALPLGLPTALALEADDDLLFYDDGTRWIWRADAAGNARVVAEVPEYTSEEDTDYVQPEAIHAAPDGAIWIYDPGAWIPRALRIAPNGALSLPFPEPADGEDVEGFALLPDGSAVLMVTGVGEDLDRVLRVRAPDGQVRPDVVIPAMGTPEEWVDADGEPYYGQEDTQFQLGVGPDGTLWLAGDYTLRRWTQAAGLATAAKGEAWEFSGGAWQSGGIAIDAEGRIYGAGYAAIERYDPRTDAAVVVAGAEVAEGTGVDDSFGDDLRTPAIARSGDLLLVDADYRQIKRIPRSKL